MAAEDSMKTTPLFDTLVNRFSALPQVEALALAGSRTTGFTDDKSDFDLYVYLNADLAPETRHGILLPLSAELELNSQFWETEDDGVFTDGMPYELIYRRLDWLEGMVARVVEKHQADTGYTTCFWANLRSSEILFDRSGKLTALKQRFDVAYPAGLRQAIVAKNWPLLREASPAFYHQVQKALARADFISVNHRVAAFLASYFDILFAVNQMPHPGEKKLLAIAKKSLNLLPEFFEKDLLNLLNGLSNFDGRTLNHLNALTDRLGELLKAQGLITAWKPAPALPAGLAFTLPAKTNAAEKPATEKPAASAKGTARPVPGQVHIFTDGGCIGNPGKGAWAYLLETSQDRHSDSGGEKITTNNRMELQGVIQSLKKVGTLPAEDRTVIKIHTDSQYVKNGITTWIHSWERNGWMTASKEPVKNQELWRELKVLNQQFKPQWAWVKGHAGHEQNEFCDALVRKTMDGL